jgi:hypothetical protein
MIAVEIFVQERPRPEIVFSFMYTKLVPGDGRSKHVLEI